MPGSSESLQARKLMTKGVVAEVTTDSPVALRLKFVRNGALSITSVTTATGTDITVVWSDSSTTVYDFATYLNVGLLVDKINSDGYFEAKILDSLRSYATATQFVDGAIATSMKNGDEVYEVLVDTSAAKYLAYRISPSRKIFTPGRAVEAHRVHLQEIVYSADINAASADSVQVYECFGINEEKVFSATSVDNTKTTIVFMSGDAKLSSLGDNHELVVIVKDGTSLANGGYLRVVGEIE